MVRFSNSGHPPRMWRKNSLPQLSTSMSTSLREVKKFNLIGMVGIVSGDWSRWKRKKFKLSRRGQHSEITLKSWVEIEFADESEEKSISSELIRFPQDWRKGSSPGRGPRIRWDGSSVRSNGPKTSEMRSRELVALLSTLASSVMASVTKSLKFESFGQIGITSASLSSDPV